MDAAVVKIRSVAVDFGAASGQGDLCGVFGFIRPVMAQIVVRELPAAGVLVGQNRDSEGLTVHEKDSQQERAYGGDYAENVDVLAR